MPMLGRVTLLLFGLWAGAAALLLTAQATHSPHVLISTVRGNRYDARTGIVRPLNGRTYTLSIVADAVSYAPSGRYRLVAHRPGQTLAFTLDDYQTNARIPVHSPGQYIEASTYAWTPDGSALRFIAIRAGDDGAFATVLAEFDVASASVRTLADLTAQMGGVFIVTFSPSRERVAVWSGRQRLYAWDVAAGRIAAETRVPNLGAVRWRDERHLLYERDDCVYQWDTASGTTTELVCTDRPLWEIAPSPDGETLALAWEAGGRDPARGGLPLGVTLAFYDFAAEGLTTVYQTTERTGISGRRPLAWSPDGRYLYSQFNTVVAPTLLLLTDARTGHTHPLPEWTYLASWETEGQLHYATR